MTESEQERTWPRKNGEQNAVLAILETKTAGMPSMLPQPLSRTQLKQLFEHLLEVMEFTPEWDNIDLNLSA